MRKSVTHLRDFARLERGKREDGSSSISSPVPVAVEGDGRAERLVVERTRLTEDGRAVGTGEHYASRLRPGRQLHRLSDPADRRRSL